MASYLLVLPLNWSAFISSTLLHHPPICSIPPIGIIHTEACYSVSLLWGFHWSKEFWPLVEWNTTFTNMLITELITYILSRKLKEIFIFPTIVDESFTFRPESCMTRLVRNLFIEVYCIVNHFLYKFLCCLG